jgi:AcrR family transcriptional regulator
MTSLQGFPGITAVASRYSGAGDPARSIEMLWEMNKRPKRGPKPILTLPQITRAAIDIADAEGLDALSTRRVGDYPGVTGTSPHSYVPGKAELFDLMLDNGFRPRAPPGRRRRRAGVQAPRRIRCAPSSSG